MLNKLTASFEIPGEEKPQTQASSAVAAFCSDMYVPYSRDKVPSMSNGKNVEDSSRPNDSASASETPVSSSSKETHHITFRRRNRLHNEENSVTEILQQSRYLSSSTVESFQGNALVC